MIVTIHDANFLVQPEAYDRGYRVFANQMFRHSARHAARILTDSAYSAGELVRLLDAPAARIVVAYPGLDQRPSRTARRSRSVAPEAAMLYASGRPSLTRTSGC